MGELIRMPIDPQSNDPAALLTLTQWLSPAYPVGAFSYSHGLEWAVETGDVTDKDSFHDWLGAVLTHGAGRNDAILLVAAFRARNDAALHQVDMLARALVPSRERLAETVLQGAAFASTTRAIWSLPLPDLVYPVAIGAAARAKNLPLCETLHLFLHGFAANLTSAAIRLIPLGQTEGHMVLADTVALVLNLVATAQTQTLDDLGACTFMADIASMKHETQYSRLFQS